ncbi:MAG: S8 family peptidase, partial [Chthoniobacterales bacterium]
MTAVLFLTAVLLCPAKVVAQLGTNAVFAAPFVGGSPQWVSFVNDFVGWRPYANAGFLGSSTVVGNIEGGNIWTGHEAFVRNPAVANGFIAYSNPYALNELDYHATMVGHVLAGSGYNGAGYSFIGVGMAPEATVVSGGIATWFSPGNLGSFSNSYASVVAPFRAFMTGEGVPRADVINSSWGGYDPAAVGLPYAVAMDGLAAHNRFSALVAAAGNSTNQPVVWPGSAYNNITVGALGGNSFLSPAGFSSRGLVDFYNPTTGVTVSNARVAVDLAAPGEHLYLAAYLGDQGGWAAAVPGLVEQPSPTNLYFVDQFGTSFASPMVAGAVSVLKDTANRDMFWNLNGLTNAEDTRVVKSVLMAGAQETFGWDNGQAVATNSAVVTTQALDAAAGAGAVDMGRAGNAYFFGTRDVAGTNGGTITSAGWDFGTVGLGTNNDYFFDGTFGQPVELSVSLNWFAGRSFDMETNLGSNLSFADLNLEVWEVSGGAFSSLVASSATIYNNSEYLRLDLAGDKNYGLRVTFDEMVFDQTAAVTSEAYGLAWLAAPYETLYWKGASNGTWSGMSTSWGADPGTNAATEARTTALDQLVVAPGTNTLATLLIDGPQIARSLSISNGRITLGGTNDAAINLQNGGLKIGSGVTAATTVLSNVSFV